MAKDKFDPPNPPVAPEEFVENTTPAPLDPTGQVTDRDILVRLMLGLEKLTERMAAPTTSAESDKFTQLIETISGAMMRVADNSLAGAKLIAEESRQAHRPSNQVVPNRSVFNQRGENCPGWSKPRLKCTMMVPWLLENESCTREEVELVNLLEPGIYTIKRNDGTKIPLTISVTYKSNQIDPSTLVITHETAFNNDNFRMMPPLADYIRQILKAHPADIARKAKNVLSEDEETALIEAGELSVSV